MAEKIYKKAPLVEVIAEVHWELKPLNSTPNASIDPYFDLFKESFIKNTEGRFLSREPLVPNEIPVEFLADQPHLRLRPRKGGWPLVQIGPGVMTANIIPKYNGWTEFAAFLRSSLNDLYASYPLSAQTLHITRTHLRYIDVFNESHGLADFGEFVESGLGISVPIRSEVLEKSASVTPKITFSTDSRFLNKSPVGSSTRIKINPGQADGKNAVVVEFHCDALANDDMQTAEGLSSWFDQAHDALHIAFEGTVSSELKAKFGDLVEVGA
jgi:uncharacterized protein (TIGR04255 family)